MAKTKRRKDRKLDRTLPVMRPNAGGIDIGATEIFVAVPADRDTESVRSFPTFTQDLHALADWLQRCRIETVAMESTGVYWIPLFQILEARNIEVHLVNAQHVHHVPGRKSDVLDCQWLQYLHSVGLLRASFRPEQAVCEIRSLMRHRENLVQMACMHVQHMHKSLDQMNSKSRILFDGPYVGNGGSGAFYSVSPDDQRFLMMKAPDQQQAALTQINVVLNWFSELQQRVPVK